MTGEPPFSLLTSLGFAALGVGIVVWVLVVLVRESRAESKLAGVSEAELGPEQAAQVDEVLREVRLFRERADAWASSDIEVALRTLETLDALRRRVLQASELERIEGWLTTLRRQRARFEARPGIEGLIEVEAVLREAVSAGTQPERSRVTRED